MVDIAAKARVREVLLMWSPQWDSIHIVRSSHIAYDAEERSEKEEGRMREMRVVYDGERGAYPVRVL